MSNANKNDWSVYAQELSFAEMDPVAHFAIGMLDGVAPYFNRVAHAHLPVSQ